MFKYESVLNLIIHTILFVKGTFLPQKSITSKLNGPIGGWISLND
jgi:hypothetical protein